MTYFLTTRVAKLAVIAALAVTLSSVDVWAAPSAEVAKRCMHFSYVMYPFKRPGAVRMSGDRQAYFKNCMEKNGDVPVPASPKP